MASCPSPHKRSSSVASSLASSSSTIPPRCCCYHPRFPWRPLLLPKEDDSTKLSTVNNISFAPDVKFTQRTHLRPNVRRLNKDQNTRQKSVRQQVTNTVAPPLTHRRSVLGDQTSRSPQYQRYLHQMLRQGQTERSCSVPLIPSKGT